MFRMLSTTAVAICLAATSVQAEEVKAIPDLKGTWEASSHVHYQAHGHVKAEAKTGTVTVLSQDGRVFHGKVGWTTKASGSDTFSGVIDKDGVTFYVAGHTEGIRIGKLEGPDAFTLYILVPGGTKPRAGFAEFKRVK